MPSLSRIQTLVLGAYLVWLVFACVAFINAHGGMSGDFESEETRLDYHPRDRYAGCLLFNRWFACGDDDPYVYELFEAVHVPARVVGQLVYKALSIIPEFRSPFPLGLSYPSYVFAFSVLAGALQWYAIALLLPWFYGKATRSE